MVEPHADTQTSPSTKRKRSNSEEVDLSRSSATTFKTICQDLLSVLDDDESTKALLDQPIAIDKSLTLRQALEQNEFKDITDLYEIITNLERIANSETATKSLDEKIKSLLRYEYTRGQELSSNRSIPQEALPGFPDRRPEQEILFTSSIAGPLFTSVAQGSGAAQVSSMPDHVHVIKVLPTPANETRILGDLHQDLYVRHSNDSIKAGHGRLAASKRLKYGPYESFSLERDRGNAILDDRQSAIFLTNSDAVSVHMPSPGNETNWSSSHSGTEQKTDPDDLTFDEDLLSFFETSVDSMPDVSAMLLRLSDLQNKRLASSSFTVPDTEEDDLAQQITTALHDQITRADISPRQLLPGGIRSNYTFTRLTQSYVGTLPPTIAQAIKATIVQNVAPSALPISDGPDRGIRSEQSSRYQVNSPQNPGMSHMTNYGASVNNNTKTTI